MRRAHFQYHRQNDLSPDINVPHTWNVLIITLQHTAGQLDPNSNIHANDEQHKTQINELYPTYGPNSISNNVLLVNWSSELSSKLDQYLNKNIS